MLTLGALVLLIFGGTILIITILVCVFFILFMKNKQAITKMITGSILTFIFLVLKLAEFIAPILFKVIYWTFGPLSGFLGILLVIWGIISKIKVSHRKAT
ncbi:hypothetical protein [Gracilibacillus salinarum]|uniref:YesK-like protein n=1 Tax=Gracilibacillus salinarum TaxID=2932255 RepID=A0ABY4GHD6_9BACI|nr:hypothetical protein [Gracilibacillus salinarum]UOQ83556.1 hypothetical protein MUN87_12395 [Gracilibacillus salinarum]